MSLPVPVKNAVCLVIDRLHAGMLGAYGNTWIRTPAFDQLASESFLFDQALIDSPRLELLYRSYWQGLHAAVPATDSTTSIVTLLNRAGIHTALVTDEPLIAQLPLAEDFQQRVLVEQPGGDQADEEGETQLGRLFAAAAEWLAAAREPFFLWVHSRGMGGRWDAPYDLRAQYAEEDDPEPPAFIDPPNRWLSHDHDPDELLGIAHAYAGQISFLDFCLAGVLDQLAESPLAETTALSLLSARGFPLGEHLRVGPCDEALYNETAQIAWAMRFPDGLGKLARSNALVQPVDLPGTLLDCLGLDRMPLDAARAHSLLPIIRGDEFSLRDRAYLISQHEQAVRTPAWHLRQPETGASELYAKPSDRWEVNEVGKLLPEIMAGLQASLADIQSAGREDQLAPLAELLVTEVD